MIHCLYHGNCYDGMGAAYAAWTHFGDTARYRPCNYAEKENPLLEIPDGDEVYVVDFSFKRDVILHHRSRLKKLTIIDHHDTAQKDLEGLDDCVFDMNKSGAVLSWEYFNAELPVPKLLLHVEDRDLWRFRYPETKAVHAALGAYPFDLTVWDTLNKEDLSGLVVAGEAILRYKEAEVEKICEKAALITLSGHLVPCCNTSTSFSEVPGRLLELYPEAPFSAYYYDYPLNGRWIRQWGLRGRKDGFNVGKLATELGGGGHPTASGFTRQLDDPVI